ncbi:hypothetical protein [Streptomyces sp. NPDC050538]|uniref:hypothetical protein n=1 Tax=Streptomyces sp. NPDC050538 TaxID=3365627 RepID=UPI0037AD7D9C
MVVFIAQEALLAAAGAGSTSTTTVPWWGTALGAGIGAIGAGLVSSLVAYINNRANRKQLKAQLDAQETMLDRQISAQREQHVAQLDAQLRQHTEQLRAQQEEALTALSAQAERSHLDIEAQRQRDAGQRQAELDKWHLESRQKAYVDFVTATERVRDTVAALSRLLSGPSPVSSLLSPRELKELADSQQQLRSLYEAAFQQAQVVRLAGPPAVASLARDLSSTMNEYINYSDERIRAAQASQQSETLNEWHQSVSRMHAELDAFLDAAYHVVESPLRQTVQPLLVQPNGRPSPDGPSTANSQTAN